jgi:hypothetical protein
MYAYNHVELPIDNSSVSYLSSINIAFESDELDYEAAGAFNYHSDFCEESEESES